VGASRFAWSGYIITSSPVLAALLAEDMKAKVAEPALR
jgi:hypothetical protein